MRSELLTPTVTAIPGQPIFVRVEVANTSEVIDEVTLTAPELDPAWLSGETTRAALFPDSRVELTARIDLPVHFPAGEHAVVIQIGSAVNPDRPLSEIVVVSVAATSRAELRLRPVLVTARRKATFRAQVTNDSNQELTLAIDARDSLRLLDFEIEPRHVTVAPGHSVETVVVASGKRPWFGSPLTRTITIDAQGADDELAATATFNQKARIPRGAATAVTLSFILGLWVTAFTVGVNQVLAGTIQAKQGPELFPLAQADLDLEAVSGLITGTVVAGTTGAALPRITVEAYRDGRDGPEIAASAATTEDGTFELAGLLPGHYLLRATAPGYAEVWSGGATSPGGAEQVRVEAGIETADVALVIEGNPGSISGTVIVNSLDGTETTATVGLLPVAEGVRGDPLGETTSDPSGFFYLADVPTPGDYELVVAAEGFEDRVVPVSLRGGEDLVANTIRMSAGPGQMQGLVSSANGPLGGVGVVISNGSYRVETVTPTSGEVGAWVVPELPTPATYLVTFSLEGYGTETVALDLGPGETRTAVDVTLVGGTGAVSGRVFDGDGNTLGGVDVAVSGGAYRATTQSLTSGDIGTWRVLDLPTPGRYTITFTLAGYSTETRVADLSASSGLDGLDVTLTRTVGSLSGTVTSGGNALSGITVTVTDGTVKRTTTSATSPAGSWLVNGLQAGTYTVTFSGAGYDDQTVLVDLPAGGNVDVDADLVPNG